MSSPFANRPGAQQTYAAMRRGSDGPAEVIDPAAHSRLDALEGRVGALEDAQHQDAAEDEQEGA